MKTMKKALAIFLTTVMTLGVMSVSAFAFDITTIVGTPIETVGITVEAPIAGYYADGLHSVEAPSYEIVDLTWTDAETDEILYSTNEDVAIVDKVYEEYSIYTVTASVYAADGYVFPLDVEAITVEINGRKAKVEKVTELGKVIVVSCDFVCEAGDPDDIGGTNTSFDQVLDFIKTIIQTFLRLIGTLLGFE